MKKAIIILAVAFFAGKQVQAQVPDSMSTTTKETKSTYYYYPDANVYYNESAKTYSWYDEPTKTWMTKPDLPSNITITKTTEKVPIAYNGNTIWMDNAAHQKKYKKAMKKLSKAN